MLKKHITEIKIKYNNIYKYKKIKIIEIIGVDGSGKTYFAKKLKSIFTKNQKVEIFHLWKKKTRSKSIKPYKKKVYFILISIIKEIYLIFKTIQFFLKIKINYDNYLIIFERSIRDLYIDPERYRLSHNPTFLKWLIDYLLSISLIIYLDVNYKTVKKRKNEISLERFDLTNKKIKNHLKHKKIILVN